MSRTSLIVATLVAGVLMIGSTAASCTPPPAEPTVDVSVALVNSGGADPPSGEYTNLAVKCSDYLRQKRYEDCENLAVVASASSDSQVVALSNAALLIAQTNQGDYDGAKQTIGPFVRTVKNSHPTSQKLLEEYGYSAAAIVYAKTGDQDAADRALEAAQRAAPSGRSAAIGAKRCAAAPGALSCTGKKAPTVAPTTPTTPTSPPPTSTPPSPSATSKAPSKSKQSTPTRSPKSSARTSTRTT